MPSLSLTHLSRRFGNIIAVDDVSLEIGSGEFFSLLGPSGCGKTTLLRMVAGFEQPTTGTITLGDRDITGLDAKDRGIGMVFQNYALFPHMTVFQNTAFGLETKKIAKREVQSKVAAILEIVHLADRMHTPVPLLSGGEQQRVALARALVVEPDVLLFDEPLSNLDVALRLSTREELRAIQRRTGITSIYVTHDQAEAMALSDRIAIMNAGRVVQVGTPSDVYEHPASVFVAEFLGGANVLSGRLDGLTGNFVSGSLTIALPEQLRTRPGTIALAIKPEGLRLQPVSAGSEAGIPGRIIEREYLGFTTTFVIKAAGQTLRATMLSGPTSNSLRPDDRTMIDIDWTKASILPGDP